MLTESHKAPEDWVKSTRIEEKIRQVVNRCIRQGIFTPSQREDIIQELKLRMLEGRWVAICDKYDPLIAPFENFLNQCLYRDCLKLRTKRVYATQLYLKGEWTVSKHTYPIYPLLESLKEQLLTAFQALKIDTPKYRLLLKVHSKQLLALEDLQAYATLLPIYRLYYFHRYFSKPYTKRQKRENLRVLLPLLQEVEGKNLQLGTVMRLIHRKLEKIRYWLNECTSYYFDREAIDNLLYITLEKPVIGEK